MSLTQALGASIAGLKATQSGLSLVASNVANAATPGYIRKTVDQSASTGSETGIGVNVMAIKRELDTYVQRQLRTENSGANYADTRAQLYSRLQQLYGQPGASNSLEGIYNNFTTTLQALSTSPDDPAARGAVISAAQQLAQQLNYTSDSIQQLRGDAELGIADAVKQANTALQTIADLNTKLADYPQIDTAAATMLDQRDAAIDQLSKLMDIHLVTSDNNQVTVFTNSGIQLAGKLPAQLFFDAQGTMSAAAQWTADPATRTVGTLMLNSPYGGSVDMVKANAIRSGQIAGLLQMRDQDLVQAQNQLDGLASAMASALSDKTITGTAVNTGVESGFAIDLSGLASGNTVTVNYTDSLTNTPRTITLKRVDDPTVLPLSDSITPAANDKVYGIDFSAGMGAVFSQISQALAGANLVSSNPSGNILQVLNDGAGNIVRVDSVTAQQTVTSLSSGSSQLPFFLDGDKSYTGAISKLGLQSVGLASRITVNKDLVADPSKLVAYQAGTAAGDSTRPDFLFQKLAVQSQQFSPNTGIGSANAPFSGSLTTFLRQIISQQGDAASAASNLQQGQDVVLNALQQRFNESSSVNVDQEMANLLTLQNSYAANARVLSTVRDMLDILLKS
jgi:flagellar hook-associated protein 1 FlgK